jgi:protein-S-isoprenylcysteine O-methyltransferase Ste14
MKIVSVITAVIGYILLILAPTYALQQAKKKHRVSLKDVKNEVKGGYLIRGLLSLIYYFCIVDWIGSFNLIPWAYIPYTLTMNIAGIVLYVITVSLFWWINTAIGTNYHGPMRLHEDHELVQTGPYAIVRHPTYSAFILLHISLSLMTANYVICISGVVMAVIVNSQRVKIEEDMLKERFGNEYVNYMSRVGKYLPKLGIKH